MSALDFIFLLYFGSHIPITIFIDSQAIFSSNIYPKLCVELLEWHCQEFKDSMMADPPAWFKAFVFSEIFLQFPFFFLAFYAFWKGIDKCRWIRVPMLVYSSHVATTLLAIIAHVIWEDFSDYEHPGPETLEEKAALLAIYSPYLIVPIMLIFRMAFGSEFREQQQKYKTK